MAVSITWIAFVFITLSGLIVCDNLYYTKGKIDLQRELCHSALRSLNGYIRYIRNQQQGRLEYGDRSVHEEQSALEIADLTLY